MESDEQQPTYRIGAVSRLTQIPPETLRVWERRYHVVEPRRAGGHGRLYGQNDVERLTLIKKLVDRGHAISTVAHLSMDELRTRLDAHEPVQHAPTPAGDGVPVWVVGESLSAIVAEHPADLEGIRVLATMPTPEEAAPGRAAEHPRIVVWDCPTVDAQTPRAAQLLLHRCRALRLVVVYGFATREHVEQLGSGRVTAIRGPLNAYELRRVLLDADRAASALELRTEDLAPDSVDGIPPRRFSPAALAKIARMSPAVQCECPQHMASLVTQITAFEAYSAECENRNEKDAAIHAMLRHTAAQARARLEDALAKLMEAEGFSV
jgi:DNA-binding transcriptional MerR regulator